jgi:hypothetical protein
MYCDLWTIGTWGHPSPPKTCWRLKWMVPYANNDIRTEKWCSLIEFATDSSDSSRHFVSSALTRIEMSEWMHKYEWWDGYISVWDSWSKLGILPDIYSSAQIRDQILVPDLYVLIVESVAYKKKTKTWKKKSRKKLQKF